MVHDHFDYSTFFDFGGKRNGLGNNSPPLRMLRVFKKNLLSLRPKRLIHEGVPKYFKHDLRIH